MQFVAICEETYYPIWAAGNTEEEAKANLWQRVSSFLKRAKAPETSEMSASELEEFFGCWILDTKEGWGIK